MKYNTTYKQLLSLKETLKWIERFKNKIVTHYDGLFSLIEVNPPVFVEEDSEMAIDFNFISRDVTIDLGDSYKIARLFQSHSNWARDLIARLKMNDNEGVRFYAPTIWRDIHESPTSTTVRQEMTFQFKLNVDIDFNDYLKDMARDFYKLLIEMLDEVQKETGITHQYPRDIKFISAQQLENEFSDLTFKEREIEALIEEEAYVFANAGKTLHSGKIHTFIPPQLYDLNNFYQIVLKDRINTDTIKVASVAMLSSGEQLADQLTMYDLSNLKAKNFYKELINREEKIMEVKINLPRLAMALLAKGHIAETQSGIISDESNTIKQRYKLEKF